MDPDGLRSVHQSASFALAGAMERDPRLQNGLVGHDP